MQQPRDIDAEVAALKETLEITVARLVLAGRTDPRIGADVLKEFATMLGVGIVGLSGNNPIQHERVQSWALNVAELASGRVEGCNQFLANMASRIALQGI